MSEKTHKSGNCLNIFTHYYVGKLIELSMKRVIDPISNDILIGSTIKSSADTSSISTLERIFSHEEVRN